MKYHILSIGRGGGDRFLRPSKRRCHMGLAQIRHRKVAFLRPSKRRYHMGLAQIRHRKVAFLRPSKRRYHMGLAQTRHRKVAFLMPSKRRYHMGRNETIVGQSWDNRGDDRGDDRRTIVGTRRFGKKTVRFHHFLCL